MKNNKENVNKVQEVKKLSYEEMKARNEFYIKKYQEALIGKQ